MEASIDIGVLSLVLAALPDPLAVVESAVARGRLRHRVHWANPAFCSLLGPADGRPEVHELAAGDAVDVIGNLLDTGAPGTADTFVPVTPGADSGGVAVRVLVTPLMAPPRVRTTWEAPVPPGRLTLVAVRERSGELRAEEHLRASEEQFRVLAEHAPIGIFRSDVGLRLGYANARCNEILGVGGAGLSGSRWLDTLAPDDRARVVTALERVLAGEEAVLDHVKVERPDGSARWVSVRVAPVFSAQRAGGFVGSVEDVTERRLLEQTLSYDATHDRLTGLPNRALLWERLRTELTRPVPQLAVIFLDLDDFKLVNDSFGHDRGDELLLAVADRLTTTVRPNDLVTRFGGDEFVVVCSDVRDEDQAGRIASRLVESLRPPFQIAGRDITVAASMGIVLGTDPGLDPETILRDADTALYQAKGAGKARWALFDERVRQGVSTRLAMASALRRAIDEDGLDVHYQPIVDMATGRTVGMEALARWTDPEFGHVPPDKFVALAEETGLIDRLGEWVLWASCRQYARWREELGDAAPGYLSVNLSARQLQCPALIDVVKHVLRATRMTPGRLCLELTETVFMDDIDGAVAQLGALRLLGMKLAMDDFGTGYSSLSSLRRFAGDYLKIDRSFVAGLRTEPTAPAIIAAVVDLAEAVGLAPVAEGVESSYDAELLSSLGCRYAQGYHYARPMPGDQASNWLRAAALTARSWAAAPVAP